MAYTSGGNFQKRCWRGGLCKGHPKTAADGAGKTEFFCPGNGCKPMGDAVEFPGADFRDKQPKVDARELPWCAGQCHCFHPWLLHRVVCASLFSEGMITNEDAFDDQNNEWRNRITNDELKPPVVKFSEGISFPSWKWSVLFPQSRVNKSKPRVWYFLVASSQSADVKTQSQETGDGFLQIIFLTTHKNRKNRASWSSDCGSGAPLPENTAGWNCEFAR